MPTMETSAATIRFNNNDSSGSDSSESDCDDDALSTTRPRLANDTGNVDTPVIEGCSDVDIVNGTSTKCMPSAEHAGSSAVLGPTIDHESVNCGDVETPTDTAPFASSDPRTCVTSEQCSEQDSKTQTSYVATAPVPSLGNHPGVVQGNQQSLRFNPFNTLCQGDDETGEDLSHCQRGRNQREQGWSQVDGTDCKAGISPLFCRGRTDGLATTVTAGGNLFFCLNCMVSANLPC